MQKILFSLGGDESNINEDVPIKAGFLQSQPFHFIQKHSSFLTNLHFTNKRDLILKKAPIIAIC